MKRIPTYRFYRHKYGSELLIDVVDYRNMWSDIRRTPVFTESFYSITLVEKGDEWVELNGKSCYVVGGTVVTSIPGEVWRFHDDTSMEALNLVFEKDFLLTFFRDSHFLDRFSYLSANRLSPFLQLDQAMFERLTSLYREMQQEINHPERKDEHLLRAMLYEALMLLSRAEWKADEAANATPQYTISRYVEHFERLVSDHFKNEHSTAFYADQLCITPNYLNKIVQQVLGLSTKAYIQKQLMQESCRQLEYTTLSVQEISTELGYETATYFIRSFSKLMGTTPLAYRNEKRKSPEK